RSDDDDLAVRLHGHGLGVVPGAGGDVGDDPAARPEGGVQAAVGVVTGHGEGPRAAVGHRPRDDDLAGALPGGDAGRGADPTGEVGGHLAGGAERRVGYADGQERGPGEVGAFAGGGLGAGGGGGGVHG